MHRSRVTLSWRHLSLNANAQKMRRKSACQRRPKLSMRKKWPKRAQLELEVGILMKVVLFIILSLILSLSILLNPYLLLSVFACHLLSIIIYNSFICVLVCLSKSICLCQSVGYCLPFSVRLSLPVIVFLSMSVLLSVKNLCYRSSVTIFLSLPSLYR